MRLPLPRHPVSVVGALLATIGAVLFLIVFFLDLFGMHTNPYLGIVFFIVLPAIFVLGLILIPIGSWRERRRRLAGHTGPFQWPRLDLNNTHQRNVVIAIVALTFVNVVIISLASYSGVEYMDSVSFCGQVCHNVMMPEFTAHQDGPHARVACVQCHIGPGASWFVRSKLDGARQVVCGRTRDVLAADSLSGAQSAPGARNVRELPLAREVPRRHRSGRSTTTPTTR